MIKTMCHLNKQKIVFSFVICLLLSATKVLACSCFYLPNEKVENAVNTAFKEATAVFSGKVVGFEYRKGIPNELLESQENYLGKHFDYETMVVKFQVERWWKGEASSVIFLVTSNTKNSDGSTSGTSCDYGFEKDRSYLTYTYGQDSELRTNSCTRTKLLNSAEDDLKILGEGKEPIEEKDKPKKPSNARRNKYLSLYVAMFWEATSERISNVFSSLEICFCH